jgi:hypothetical protein
MRKTLIKRKKTSKSKRKTRKNCKRGGGKWGATPSSDAGLPYEKPSNIRNQLVQAWKENNTDKYNENVDKILNNYKSTKAFIGHLDNEFASFKPETIVCLDTLLTTLKQRRLNRQFPQIDEYISKVPDAMAQTLFNNYNYAMNEIEKQAGSDSINYDEIWKRYDLVTQQIIYDFREHEATDFFDYLESDYLTPLIREYSTLAAEDPLKDVHKTRILSLERSLTQLQEDGIPPSMIHLAHVIEVRDGRI